MLKSSNCLDLSSDIKSKACPMAVCLVVYKKNKAKCDIALIHTYVHCTKVINKCTHVKKSIQKMQIKFLCTKVFIKQGIDASF